MNAKCVAARAGAAAAVPPHGAGAAAAAPQPGAGAAAAVPQPGIGAAGADLGLKGWGVCWEIKRVAAPRRRCCSSSPTWRPRCRRRHSPWCSSSSWRSSRPQRRPQAARLHSQHHGQPCKQHRQERPQLCLCLGCPGAAAGAGHRPGSWPGRARRPPQGQGSRRQADEHITGAATP